MREYELMYILDPTLDEDSTQALIGQVGEFMAKQGIEVEKTDPWGKRRLAYQIGKHWDGFYVLSLLKAAPESVSEVERRLRVTDGVLRFITVRVDEEEAKMERRRVKKKAHEAARRERGGVAASSKNVEDKSATGDEAPSESADKPAEPEEATEKGATGTVEEVSS